MAIVVQTKDPKGLLDAIRKAIKSEDVEAWEVDDDGDFTLSSKKWTLSAWLRPNVTDGKLTLNTIGPAEAKMSTSTYAVYHSQFIEMLLEHFDSKFVSASATALPTVQDALGGRRRVSPRQTA